VGEAAFAPLTDPEQDSAEFLHTLAHGGYTGGSAETPRTVARKAERQPLGTSQALPGGEEGSLKRDYSTDWKIHGGPTDRRSVALTKNAS
jgi:hypothetical protein